MKKGKKLFRKKNPVKAGLYLSSIFIIFIIISYIFEEVTKKVRETIITNDFIEGCASVGFVGEQLQRCITKSEEAGKLRKIQVEDCGGCEKTIYGENQLCLIGNDKIFCEQKVEKDKFMINLGYLINYVTRPLSKLSTRMILIWTSVMFIIGYFLGGGRLR